MKKGLGEDLGYYKVISLTSNPRKMMVQLNLEACFGHVKDRKMTGFSEHGFTGGLIMVK